MNNNLVTLELIDSKRERDLITYSIMEDEFLSKIYPAVRGEYLTKPMKTVWKWISEYYQQYGQAPKNRMADIYMMYRSTLDTDAEIIGPTLDRLSEGFKPLDDYKHLVQVTLDFLNERALRYFKENFDRYMELRNYTQASNIMKEFVPPSIQQDSLVTVLDETLDSKVADCFTEGLNLIYTPQGAIGSLLGPLSDTDCVCIAAYKGVGKTWAVQHLGIEAMEQGNDVLFISFEMTEEEMLVRLYQELMVVGTKNESVRYGVFFKDQDADELFKLRLDQLKVKRGNYTAEDIANFRQTYFAYSTHPKAQFKVLSLSSNKHTLVDIQQRVKKLELYENVKPKVIVIDYPALIKHGHGLDRKNQLNEVWMQLRAWAKDEHCLIVAPAQVNREGGISSMPDVTHIADSDDIIAHVTHLIIGTQTPKEKAVGITRWAQLKARNYSAFSDQVIALSCHAKGQTWYDSRFLSDVDYQFKS